MLEFEQKLREEAILRSLSEVTFKTYFFRLRRFYNYYQKPLSEISIQEIREYFIYLINVKECGKEAVRNTKYALRFYYVNCLKVDNLDYEMKFIVTTKKPKLPVILSRSEVRKILDKVHVNDYRICLELIYTCGLRIGEAVKLKVSDIDSERKIITIRNGKGGKDRAVPVPNLMLEKLRKYWLTHRNQKILFPRRSRIKTFDRSTTDKFFTRECIQVAMKLALKESEVNKIATPHTLRHSYATHLLEAGAHIKAISIYLGHRSLRPTMIYLHLTNNSEIHSYNILNSIMSDL